MLSLFSPALPSAGEGGYVVARLDQPWPASVGRASPAAGRAIRMLREANASHVELTLAAAEWQRLQEAAGARATLLARDATAHYARRAAAAGRALAEQRRPGVGEAPGRRLASGSMGGFLTLSEAYAELERLRSEHPTLLTELPTQGKSRQGRPLRVWCATAGLGECTRASARPAVLYTSLVHAREPQTLMCLLRFLQVTLDSAARDADSQAARCSTPSTPSAPPWPHLAHALAAAPLTAAGAARPVPQAAARPGRQPGRVRVEPRPLAARRRHAAQERSQDVRSREWRRGRPQPQLWAQVGARLDRLERLGLLRGVPRHGGLLGARDAGYPRAGQGAARVFLFSICISFFYRRSARWSRSTARRQRCTGAGCSGSEAVVVANGGGAGAARAGAAAESGSGAGREPKQCGAGHGWGARSRII